MSSIVNKMPETVSLTVDKFKSYLNMVNNIIIHS